MSLNTWFGKGKSPALFIETFEKHKEAFEHIYDSVVVPQDELFFKKTKERNLRVIVLAEPWCGHCLLNIPVLLRFAEKVNMPVRFLHRDENLPLMDRYLTNGKSRTIPIFIFIDENGKEVAKWGPISPYTKQFVDQLKEDLPEKDAPDFKEKFTELVEFTAKEFRGNAAFWNASYESMKQTLIRQL